jgi:hypothetical protein
MKTFIRVAEIWIPDKDNTRLEFAAGLYGNSQRFSETSAEMKFERGEGLPGAAWERGTPVIFTRFEGSTFRRKRRARAIGLTSGVAIPVVGTDSTSAVLVFMCGDDASQVGAIELWHAKQGADEMRLVDGYYGPSGAAFAAVSRAAVFRKGVGLPGTAWEIGEPFFIEDLGRSTRFLRAAAARPAGINRGLGIPCPTRDGTNCVLAFLSGAATPIARRIEVWKADGERRLLHRTHGFCETVGVLPPTLGNASISTGKGAIGVALQSGLPSISENAAGELAAMGLPLLRTGIKSMVALPLLTPDRASVVAWYF